MRSNTQAVGALVGRRGFALVLAIATTALLFLAVLGSAVALRARAGVAGRVAHEEAARRHAMIALDAAFGELQRWAGPDHRITATSEHLGAPHLRYTGVWDATNPGAQPLSWLVSGNEGPDPLRNGPGGTEQDTVEVVGAGSSDPGAEVRVPLRTVREFPGDGMTGPARVAGRYGWWVGDQGVKASVASADAGDSPQAAPFDSEQARRRRLQQLAPVALTRRVDPLDPANEPLIPNLAVLGHLAHLQRADGSTPGYAALRERFHDWTNDNRAVLADTGAGGLRRDLSLMTDMLGQAAGRWLDYGSYMEDPAVAPEGPGPVPAIQGQDAIRRRYRMISPTLDGGIVHSVAPVASYFLLGFNVRTDPGASGAVRPLQARARWMLSLWNPYTGALVPEDLIVEVAGLPEALRVVDDSSGGVTAATLPLDSLFGSPLRMELPWVADARPDRHTWLPGRIYTWASREHLPSLPVPPGGFPGEFYTRNLSASAGQGVQRSAAPASIAPTAQIRLAVDTPTTLTVRLLRHGPGGGMEMLSEFESPEFASFVTSPGPANAATWQFCFFVRLAESIDNLLAPDAWLSTDGTDPRSPRLPGAAYVTGANGNRPELYPNFVSISFPDRLLDRALPATPASSTGQSYNEDVPVFELPRAPVLSLGGLQHLQIEGRRPFAIGNPWGAEAGWNSIFDRVFLSGLDVRSESTGSLPLPNPRLRLVAGADGRMARVSDLFTRRDDGYSSAHLLQGGAFNVNSTSAEAWSAVLRGARLPGAGGFEFLDANLSTGTGTDQPARSTAGDGAMIFRFPQSAQETFEADSPGASSTYAASTTAPPAAPNTPSNANTHLFRRGMRILSPGEVDALGASIASLVGTRLRAMGPFRTLEEFLSPHLLFAGGGLPAGLIERAISDCGLNAGVAEFSSQWLTQADLISGIAPFLFVRSDTFLIRVYGDSVNPATGAVEARAWAEAEIQRYPDFLDPADAPWKAAGSLVETNGQFGRRFRVTGFRWIGRDGV